MYTPPTAPLPIGSLLDDAIRLFRAALPRCWLIALLGSLAVGAASVYALYRFGTAATPDAMLRLFASPSFVLGYVASMVLYLYFYVAVVTAIDDVAGGHAAGTGATLGRALRRLPAAAGAMIVVVIVITVGFLLLVVPGVYLAGALVLTLVAVVRGDGVFQSLATSRRLVRGHWWRTTAVIGVGMVIMIVLMMVFTFASTFLSMSMGADVIEMTLVNQGVSTLLNVVAVPMLAALLVALYRDLELRRAGDDLARRIGELPAA